MTFIKSVFIGIFYGLKYSVLWIESDCGIDSYLVKIISIMLLTHPNLEGKISSISWERYRLKVKFEISLFYSNGRDLKKDERG